MDIGNKIKQLRLHAGMTQEQLAAKLGISAQSVSKWENNSAVPELEKLIKMAQIFGITIDELVTGETKEAAPVTTHTPPPESAPARQGLSPQQLASASFWRQYLPQGKISKSETLYKHNEVMQID